MEKSEQVEEISFGGFMPITRDAKVVQTPFLVTGGIAKYLGRIYREAVERDFGGNETLMNGIRYNEEKDALTHSHPLSLNVFGQIIGRINPAFRVTSYRDLKNSEIEEIAKREGCYIDAGDAWVLRGNKMFFDEKDNVIFSYLRRKVDNLDTPVLVRGVKVVNNPRDKNGYGLKVVQDNDFSYTHDTKEFGEEEGWIQSDAAISALFCGGAILGARRGGLVNSSMYGRVVLVSREAKKS